MTQVYFVSDHKISEIEDSNPIGWFEDVSDAELQRERIYYEEKAQERALKFDEILKNSPIRKSVVRFSSNILGCIIISVASTFFCSLIPVHSLLNHPEFWYEMIIPGVPWSILNGLYFSFVASSYMNLNHIKQIRYIIFLCLLGCIITIVIIVSAHTLWSYGLGYQIPLPFTGYAVAYFVLISNMPVQWFMFPLKWRKNPSFQKRLKYLMLNYASGLVIPVIYNMMAKMLLTVPGNYQPIVSFGFPVLEKITCLICNVWVRNASNGDSSGSTLINNCIIATRHIIQLCYVLGSIATDTTTWVIMGMTFISNIYSCLEIMWEKKRNPREVEKLASLLQNLASTEMIEVLASLTFMLSLIVAYFGPNASLIGNVGSSLFHYRKIVDIGHTVANMFSLFLTEFSSIILTGAILKIFSNINLISVFIVVESEFGMVFCILLSFMGAGVSLNLGIIIIK